MRLCLPLLLLLLGPALAAGCGRGHRAAMHATETQTAAPDPTPDTTPIAALRTPAGLALKIDQPPAVTPSPSSGIASQPAPTKAAP